MVLPNSLLFMADRVSGFSCNQFRIMPNGSSTAEMNSIVSFDLPSNTLVNLKSFKVFFKATLTGSHATRLPADIHSLIERVEVLIGGVLLSQFNFNNVLHKMQAVCHSESKPLAHTEMVRASSYYDGSDLTGTDKESPSFKLCWDDFSNTFLGSAEPSILDSSLVPDIKVRIHIAGASVLSTASGVTLTLFDTTPANASAAFSLSDLSASIECVSIADSIYEEMTNNLMQKAGYLEIPYKTYHSFHSLHSGSTRFSVSSQSLDRIWIGWRDSNYATLSKPVRVEGYRQKG
eukprot:5891989-Pleurochrysis_carterae.AAC.1